MTYVSDTGDLKDLSNVQISEQVRVVKVPKGPTGAVATIVEHLVTADYRDVTDTDADTHSASFDYPKMVGNRNVPLAIARATTLKAEHLLIDKDTGKGTGKELQFFLFRAKGVGLAVGGAAGVGGVAGAVIKQSGFGIAFETEKKAGKYYLRIQKQAEANNGADKGEINAADSKQIEVEII